MTTDNRRNNFFTEMEKLRRRADRPKSVEIVRLAMEAGLTKKEVLSEVTNAYGKLHMRSRNYCDALSQFLSVVCETEGMRRVLLEYSFAFISRYD